MSRLLEDKATAWRRQALHVDWMDGAARLICGGILGLAAVVWLDQAARLSQTTRWGLLGGGAVALVGGLYAFLLRPCWARDRGSILDAAGREFPEAAMHLRPAWELSRGASEGTSEALRLAHADQTEALLRSLPERPVFRWRANAGLRALAAGALLGGLSLGWAPSGAISRLAAPWRDMALENYLTVTPGDASVEWGRPSTIVASWKPGAAGGRGRYELTLWLSETGSWRKAAWDKSVGGDYRFTADGLTSLLRYRLTWRDLESRRYSLTPVQGPLLESPRARVHGGESAELSAAQPFEVMRGALVTVAGRPNQPLARAALGLSSSPQPISMKLSPAGEYEASFVAQEDAVMRFELETPDGRGDAHPPVFSLRVRPDQAPSIELLSPQEPVLAGPADAVPVAYAAKDDGGLTRLILIVRAPGKAEREIPLPAPGGVKEQAGDFAWELSGLPLGRVEFQLKAVDNASPPQSGYSAKGIVEIADLQGAHTQAGALWRKAEQSLKSAAEASQKARSSEGKSEPVAEADLSAQAREWNRAVEDMRALAESLAKDAYANPGVAEEAKAAAEGLSAAQAQELPEAQRATRRKDAEAGARQERLAQRLERARQALEEGRALQGLQDFHQQSARLTQTGSSLEAGLEALAKQGKPSPESAAKLSSALEQVRQQLEALQKSLDSLPKSANAASDPKKTLDLPVESARRTADAMSQALARGDFEEAARLARKLSEELAKIQDAVGRTAASSAAAALAPEAQQKVEKLEKEWSAVVEEQTRLLERSQKIEDERLAKKVSAQKELLGELARRQSVIVSSAASQPGFPADALSVMRQAQTEFERRKVEAASSLLRAASSRARGVGMEGIARAEDEVASTLEGAAAQAAGPAGPEADAAGREQAALKGRTSNLKLEIQGLESAANSDDEVSSQLSEVEKEQDAAAQALGRRDSGSALGRQQRALELLTQGSGQMSQSAQGQSQRRSSMLQPFQRRSSVRLMRQSGGSGGSGSQMGFVPLPSAKDNLPVKALREELQKSLQENRPPAQDSLIKEYFKRLSQ